MLRLLRDTGPADSAGGCDDHLFGRGSQCPYNVLTEIFIRLVQPFSREI